MGMLVINIYTDMFKLIDWQVNAYLFAQIGWLVAACIIFYLVVKTYLHFKMKKLAVASFGFLFICLAYAVNLVMSLLGTVVFELEIFVNVAVALGYGAVTIAIGWLRD
jgi:FtsH-binding integral membrane protein